MSDPEGMSVNFTCGIRNLKLPRHYRVILLAEGFHTGVEAKVWGHKRALEARDFILEQANELLNELDLAAGLMAVLKAARKEKAMTDVKVGQRVKLAVDIGTYKRGRVCRVVEIAAEGSVRHGISVQPIWASGDPITFHKEDTLPLQMGEYVGLDDEVPE